VSSAGLVTAKTPGSAIVSATSQNGELTTFCLISVAPAIDELSIGLIAYYPFNNAGVDASGHGYDGMVHNISSVVDRFGKANAAYHFDGYSSYISVPDNQALRLSNTDFTLNAWVKLDAYNSSFVSSIIAKRFSGVNNGWLWAINGPQNTPLGAAYFGPGGGNSDAIGNIVLSTGQWYMVTCIYNYASHQLSIYINGVLDRTVSNILPPNGSTNAPLFIGKDNSNGIDQYFFQGSLDEIRIYGRAITATELNKLYTAAQ
jgi:hypothetical protein